MKRGRLRQARDAVTFWAAVSYALIRVATDSTLRTRTALGFEGAKPLAGQEV